MDKVREDVLAKWTPDKVQEACGVDEATCFKVAETMAKNRPSTIVWCMGQTQHTDRQRDGARLVHPAAGAGQHRQSPAAARTSSAATTTCRAPPTSAPTPIRCPATTALAEGSWKHFAKAWGVDFEWIKKQYAPGMMTKPGMTVSRWIDGVLEKNELIDQDSNLRGLFFWGHAPNSQTRGLEMKKAMDKLDLLVVIDPFPSATAAMAAMPGKAEDLNPNRAVYLLPAATQFETSGSCTASNRSIQWREKVIEPLWESRTDHMIMYQLAKQAGLRRRAGEELQDGQGQGAWTSPCRVHPPRDQPRSGPSATPARAPSA